MADNQRLHSGNPSKQLESFTLVMETLQETKSNNEKFWHLERAKQEDNAQRSRDPLRELKQRLLNGCEQSDQNGEMLQDLSRSMREVCDQIETSIQKINQPKHGTSVNEKKQNGVHPCVKTTKQLSGDTSRDGVRNGQRHHVTPHRKQTKEGRAPTESNSQPACQQFATSKETGDAIKGGKDETGVKVESTLKKEVKNSASTSNTTVPTRIVPQCLPKPCVITRNDSGLKTSKTETDIDNRLTYLKDHSNGGARSRSRGRRKFADMKLKNLNISKEDVTAAEKKKEETPDHFLEFLKKMFNDEMDESIRKRLDFLFDGARARAGMSGDQQSGDLEDELGLGTFLKSLLSKHGGEDEFMIGESPNLPPLGTRMRRGPGWHCPDDKDSHGPGTIVSHARDGMICVEWDNGQKGSYSYINAAEREVVEVNEPRVLKHQLIAPGCRVKRGPDWKPEFKNQDGGPGNMGTVIRVHRIGMVVVRWDVKNFDQYRFGYEGKFDLELCNEVNSSRSHRSRDLPRPNGDGLLIESFLDPVEVMNRRNESKSNN